jgi:hypothetical protein
MDSMGLIRETIKEVFAKNNQDDEAAEQFYRLFANKMENNVPSGDLARMIKKIKLRGEVTHGD